MHPVFLIGLFVLVASTNAAPNAAPQLGGLLGGLLGSVPVVEPILGATGELLNEIPLLYASPPSFLLTEDPSPQCANINGGKFFCFRFSQASTNKIVLAQVPFSAATRSSTEICPSSLSCQPWLDTFVSIPTPSTACSVRVPCPSSP